MEQDLQRLINALFAQSRRVDRLDVITLATAFDVDEPVREILESLPSGSYSRPALVDQLNSSIAAHGWRRVMGLVE